MAKIYKRKCNYCGKYYEGRGQFYCSHSCAGHFGFKGQHWSEEAKRKMREHRLGLKSPLWKGFHIKHNRYYLVQPNHPLSYKDGDIPRYILVAEFCFGYHLKKGEIIHHINENTLDDSPKNLFIFPDNPSHLAYHCLLKRKMIELITQSNLPTIDESSLPDNLRC